MKFELQTNGHAQSANHTKSGTDEREVYLRREVGLLSATAITVGSIVGSGIFVSPKGVFLAVGSVGLSVVAWIACGVFATIGALCFAELGVTFPSSGGEYTYLHEAFGPVAGFLFLWAGNLIILPSTNAILALTFAKYITSPFFGIGITLPDPAIRLLAAAAICFFTFLNCYDVRGTTRVQNGFMFAKIISLALIILIGLVFLILGHTENFENAFEGTTTDPGKIAIGFYSGIFAYNGWQTLNLMTEELKNPEKTLPRAIYISMAITTFIYILTNVAYFVILSPKEMRESNAIAVTFGQSVFGSLHYLHWIMPAFVAISSLGGLSVHIMTSSRLLFSGARQGHFPEMLSLIQVKRMTPAPALIFLGMLSLGYLCSSDIYALINYNVFIQSVANLATATALIYMRIKRPELPRPVKIHMIYPVLFFITSLFLVVLPIYVRPVEVGIGTAITLSGVPIYAIFIGKKDLPLWFRKMNERVKITIQKTFLSLPED